MNAVSVKPNLENEIESAFLKVIMYRVNSTLLTMYNALLGDVLKKCVL